MTDYDFTKAQEAWIRLPLEGAGYFSAHEFLRVSNADARALIERAREDRFSRPAWCELFHSFLAEKTILDFGCGFGLEALELARRNDIVIADLNASSLAAAARTFALFGRSPVDLALISGTRPFLHEIATVDVFYCSGVLHHTPRAAEILHVAREFTRDTAVLGLYTDHAWSRVSCDTPPENITEHPDFPSYLRAMDEVGHYADWYDADKLQQVASDQWRVESFDYLPGNEWFARAILRPC